MSTTTKTIKAIYHTGMLKLNEPLDFKAGEEVIVTVAPSSSLSEAERRALLLSTAGGWKDIVDEDLEEYLYALRRVKTRPEVEPWT